MHLRGLRSGGIQVRLITLIEMWVVFRSTVDFLVADIVEAVNRALLVIILQLSEAGNCRWLVLEDYGRVEEGFGDEGWRAESLNLKLFPMVIAEGDR